MMPISQELVNEINHLIALTNDGKIVWTAIPGSPNAYKWERSANGKNYQITIQIQNLNHPTAEFCFLTIVRLAPPPAEAVLQINTQIDIEYKAILKSLYTAVGVAAKNALSNILSDLTKGL
jgi:hypothetical protein